MSGALSRVGDIGVGVCVCHDHPKGMVGIIITGSTNVSTCHNMQSRIMDIVLGACGHPGIIVTSFSKCSVNNRGAAHVGAIFTGCFNGIIITGCGKVIGNGS